MEVDGVDVPLWLLLLTSVVFIAYIYATWTFDTFIKLGIPGPKPIPFFGNILEVIKKGNLKFDEENVQTYGTLVGIFEGRQPVLHVSDPEILKQIMVKEFNNFVNRKMGPNSDPPFDQSLPGLKNDHWKRVRSLLTPAFSSGKLKQMNERINKCAQWLVEYLMEKAKKKEEVDMKQCAGAFSMDVISGTAFGIETNCLKNPQDRFVGHILNMVRPRMFNIIFQAVFPNLLRLLRRYLGIRLLPKESVRFFIRIVKSLIIERRNKKNTQLDFMQLMLNAHKDKDLMDAKDIAEDKANGNAYDPNKRIAKAMTTEEIIAQGLVFFLAGTETTGTTVSFFTYIMATHPDIQERLIAEIDREVGDQENLSPEIFEKLPYLDMCLTECLRLYNPAVRMDRRSNNDTVIKGIKIPKGTAFVICAHAVHHNPEFWTDPYKFDPERFSPENKEKIIPMTYIPFGFGPRNCVGMRLALIEMKTVIAKVFQNFRFRTCEKTPIPVTFTKGFLLQSAEKLFLLAEKRNK